MKDKYIKFYVVYDKYRYLCTNRRLTCDVEKARAFSSAEDAYRFASYDIRFGNAEIFRYVPGCVREAVKL